MDAIAKLPLDNVLIVSNFVEFDFQDEDTLIIKEIKYAGITPTNFVSIAFIPVNNEFHDIEDFIVENIRIEIKEIKRDSVVVAVVADNGASDKYKFKFILQWQSR